MNLSPRRRRGRRYPSRRRATRARRGGRPPRCQRTRRVNRVRSFPTISRQMASLALLAVEPLRVVKTPPREVCDFQEQAVSPSRFATLRRSSSNGSEVKQGTSCSMRPSACWPCGVKGVEIQVGASDVVAALEGYLGVAELVVVVDVAPVQSVVGHGHLLRPTPTYGLRCVGRISGTCRPSVPRTRRDRLANPSRCRGDTRGTGPAPLCGHHRPSAPEARHRG